MNKTETVIPAAAGMTEETRADIFPAKDSAARAASFPYIIWDMDGTLIDSMPYWGTLGADYLKMHGITPPENLDRIVDNMTMEESAAYFHNELGLDQSEPDIIAGELALIEDEYRRTIPAKPFAGAILRAAAANGARMCILTTSEKPLVEAVLTRLGLIQYFEAILTATELHMDKRSGAIYEAAAARLGFDITKTLICEDAPYAIAAAKETAAAVMAFYEPYYASEWSRLQALADLSE